MTPPTLGSRAGWFDDLEAPAYLNHAAVSPHNRPLRRAVQQVMDDYGRKGMGAFGPWLARREALRGQLGALMGAPAESIGFVPNTTAGVIAVAQGIEWRAGDVIVLFEEEFPANTTPWQLAAEQYGLEIRWVPMTPFLRSHEEGLAALRQALRGGVRLVAVSAVQFRTGLRMPLRDIAGLAHDAGGEVFVDGIQALGGTPLDADEDGFDYLSAGGHKWLMGAEGAGVLYVHPKRAAALQHRLAGWLGHEQPFDFLMRGPGHLRYDRPLRQGVDVVEQGTQNLLGYVALEASVGALSALGVDAIYSHVGSYLDALEQPLCELGFRSLRDQNRAGRSTLLCLEVPQGVDAVRLHACISQRGVVSAIPDGVLRLSPHWHNSLDETPMVCRAIEASLREVT